MFSFVIFWGETKFFGTKYVFDWNLSSNVYVDIRPGYLCSRLDKDDKHDNVIVNAKDVFIG